jgi:ligand-binding SRPBCC domain-containing protein
MQLTGPYRLWHHTHELLAVDGGAGTLMRDTVRYALPFGVLGEIARRTVVRRDLEAIFDFRRSRVPELVRRSNADGGAARA